MRTFSYFRYENFDADREAENPDNPRNFLGEETDALLSWVAALPANTCSYSACADQFGTVDLDQLIAGGILRCEGGMLALDSPIFLREDAAALRAGTTTKAVQLADRLETELPRIRACCSGIQNGFSVERNLYHLLCAAVFDGLFFDERGPCRIEDAPQRTGLPQRDLREVPGTAVSLRRAAVLVQPLYQ